MNTKMPYIQTFHHFIQQESQSVRFISRIDSWGRGKEKKQSRQRFYDLIVRCDPHQKSNQIKKQKKPKRKSEREFFHGIYKG